MSTVAAPRMTPDDLLRLPDQGKSFELVNGELKEVRVGYLSRLVAGQLFARLSNHVKGGNLGWLAMVGASYRCFPDDPDKVRRADTAFHSLDRLTPEQALTEGHCTVVPDLVVEVVSPNDRDDEVEAKRIDWLSAGAKLVWIVRPAAQTIHASHADGSSRIFTRDDTLSADPVLPDFRVPVADLFRLPAAKA